MPNTVPKIRSYIFENFLLGYEDSDLGNNDSFLDQSIIDSTGMLELVKWVQDTFGIVIEDDEFMPENLDSVNRVSDFIARKQA